MKKSDCIFIGKIFKPHGVKGELAVKFELFFLEFFNEQKFFMIEIFPDDELVPFFIEYAETDEKGNGKIKFDDYNTMDEIKLLIHKKIFLPSDFINVKNKKIEFAENFIGYSVSDKKYGQLGIVIDLLETAHQKTLIIKKADNEILIPFVKEFIVKTDKKSKMVFTKIPDGLLEI